MSIYPHSEIRPGQRPEQFQFELEFKLFARIPFLVIAGRAIGRGGKVRVAKSSAATARREPARAVLIQVKQQIIMRGSKIWVQSARARSRRILRCGSVAAFAVQAAAGDVLGL